MPWVELATLGDPTACNCQDSNLCNMLLCRLATPWKKTSSPSVWCLAWPSCSPPQTAAYDVACWKTLRHMANTSLRYGLPQTATAMPIMLCLSSVACEGCSNLMDRRFASWRDKLYTVGTRPLSNVIFASDTRPLSFVDQQANNQSLCWGFRSRKRCNFFLELSSCNIL